MLAQFSSKDKQSFFNLKPTVIDKLISKNKSSIQNSLLYTNEDSDGSVSEDSEASSSSSRESNISVPVFRPAVIMAPVKKKEKSIVLDQKSPKSQIILKRGPGRPPNQTVRGSRNLKVIAAKKLLENSKRGAPKKIVKDLQPTEKVRKNPVGRPPLKNVNRAKASLKKETPTTTVGTRSNNSGFVKPLIKRKTQKAIKNLTQTDSNGKSILKNMLITQTDSAVIPSNRSSPRKFPNNMIDRWKSTGFVIRGRGRGRGRGISRGSFRSSLRRGLMRSERYNTRESQTGIMRSGKKRKCSDSNLVDGLDKVKRKRKNTVNQIKREKNECPSDEQSSFVTISELSFCDNENSFKQSDEETVHTRSTKIKVEVNDSDYETQSRDTNSNVFLGSKKISTSLSCTDSDIIDQSNSSKTLKQNAVRLVSNKVGRGRKKLLLLRKTIISKSESSFKDSDCSIDSDCTVEDATNSPKSMSKRQRRKGVDGIWVRRSTRSIGKTVDKVETDNVTVEEFLKEEDLSIDLDVNSKSSFNIDDVNLVDADCTVKDISKQTEESRAVIQTPINDNKNVSFVGDCTNINDDKKNIPDFIDHTTPNSTNEEINLESDSTNFSLVLEETPVKSSSTTIILPETMKKLVFDIPPEEKVSAAGIDLIETTDSSAITLDINNENQISCFKQENISFGNLLKGINSQHVELNNHLSCDESVVQRDFQEVSDSSRDIDKCKVADLPGPFEEKNTANVSDSSDQISDENISKIDSFCQSNSKTNLLVDKNSLESLNNSGDSKEIIKQDTANLSSNENSFIIIKSEKEHERKPFLSSQEPNSNASYQENEYKLTSRIESKVAQEVEEKDTSNSNLVINEICENAVNEIINLERNEFSGVMESQNYDSLNNCKSLRIDSCYDSTIKMDVDIESADKAPESSEESSSDTNSNMSELMSSTLETDTLRRDSQQARAVIEENRSEVSLSEENINNISNDPGVGTSSQSGSFSSIRTDLSSKEICSDDSNSQRKLFSNANTEESTGERPSKELLSALGLQSLHSVAEEKTKRPNESYTGTLKAVIKLSRSSDKKGRKIFFKQGDKLGEDSGGGDRLEYRIYNAGELSTEGVPLTHLSDIPANRKAQLKVKSQFDLSNSPNIVGASGSMETPSTSEVTKEAGGKQNLVIPEKSSSFSIHPERLCTDVCSYCFGKFGSLDTPCHLAQLKNSERQAKILAIEVHLSADSCLCDGCFRYVDRKANCPTSQRSRKPAARRGPLAGTICAVQDCTQPARHSVRRKWLIKLKKSIGKKLVIDMDKNPHLPFPLCSQHYYWVDYFTVCGICKKRLTRNHMYALGPEADELNQALSDDGIPVRLSDKLFLCKLCRYYSSLRLKYRDPSSMSSTHRLFLNSYRKKILQYHDIPVSDSEEEGKCVGEENASEPAKSKKKRSKTKSLDGHESKKRGLDKEEKSDTGNEDRSNDSQMIDYSYLDTLNVHREVPTTPTGDYSSLSDFDSQVRFSNIASLLNPLEGAQGTVYPSDSQNRSRGEKPTRIQVKFGNLNIGKLSNLNIGQDTRSSNTATPTNERPPYLPGERELNLAGEFEFHGALNPNSGWERCSSTIQFDRDTKKLWQELQRPYGSQSSFLRHLVILEKHWRNGSLVLAENPNPRAVKYINSVQNRLQAYDGAISPVTVEEKPNKPEVAVTLPPPPRPMSTPVKTTSAPPPLMKIAPGTTPWLNDQLRRPPPYYSMSSTPTITTNTRLVPVTAPPPYRFPSGPRTIRLPTPSPTYSSLNCRGQHNVRPVSISYQQFKRIRLEKPCIAASQVSVTAPAPKKEPTSTATSESASKDFAPLISDVRSLATSSSSDWNESFRQQQQKMLKQNFAKYYTPILPKIPNSLTLTSFPQTTALVMKTGSLTIEKAPSDSSSKPTIIPQEKPSISVFRETTPSEKS